MIPYLDLKAQDRDVLPAIRAAIDRVLESGTFILGSEGKTFETELAHESGMSEAIGLNSGTDALLLTLRELGVKSGDEVITTPFTFIATAEMIVRAGAKPVFVDVDEMLNLDPTQIRLSPATVGLLPVHLYGQPADLNVIADIALQEGLWVVEDAAQAIGARFQGDPLGGLSNAVCLSFFPAKNLGAYGDAGAALTNDSELAARLRRHRNHGSARKYHHEFIGDSSRLDELQAAILRAKLPFLTQWTAARQAIAARYTSAFSHLSGIRPPVVRTDRTCVYQQYTIRSDRRDELAAYLKDHGVPTAIHYPTPLHLQPAFRYLGYKEGDFPEAERASREVLSLPCYPGMPDDHIQLVIDSITEFTRVRV